MKMILDFNPDACSACGACAIACMDQNDIDIEAGVAPLRVVCQYDKTSETQRLGFLSIACMHCDDAPCIIACPTGCIQKDAETSLTVYNNNHCIGCHSCAMACPFGAPSFDQNGKMIKCTGCAERLHHHLEPACVRTCPTGALAMISEEELCAKHQKQSLAKIARLIQR